MSAGGGEPPRESNSDTPERDDSVEEAQARLDQIRHQAGGALSGRELASRFGMNPDEADPDAPPLDWRLTPRNILLQLAAVAVFLGVMGFLGMLLIDSIRLLVGG